LILRIIGLYSSHFGFTGSSGSNNNNNNGEGSGEAGGFGEESDKNSDSLISGGEDGAAEDIGSQKTAAPAHNNFDYGSNMDYSFFDAASLLADPIDPNSIKDSSDM
jgi:hypothetical protein